MAATAKTPTRKTALLWGVGYTARALVPALKRRGYDVVGTGRTVPRMAEQSKLLGIKTVLFNGRPSPELRQAMAKADIIISSLPPSDEGRDPLISAMRPDPARQFPKLSWAGYLSATSVYGDRQGQWVFEDEGLFPRTVRGRHRAEVELSWLESGLPVHIFRLAGIYGPDLSGQARNAFGRLKAGTARAIIKRGHVFNRIHVEDIVSALMASIDRPRPLRIYNLADGNPAPPQDVINYAADLLQIPHPPQYEFKTAQMSDMARSFYTESKRIDISRARQELGWAPKYVDYKQGLKVIYEKDHANA